MSDGISQAYRDAEEADKLRRYRILALRLAIDPSADAREAAMAAYREYNRDARYHPMVEKTLGRLEAREIPAILHMASLLKASGYRSYEDREAGIYRQVEALAGIRFANSVECGNSGYTKDPVSAIRRAIERAYPDANGEDEFIVEIPPEVADLLKVTRTRKARRDAN